MNKQRKVLITITYNEMGIIIDTKAEEFAQPNLQPTCNQLATDCISRQAATQTVLEFIVEYLGGAFDEDLQKKLMERMNTLPAAQPQRIKGHWIEIASSNHTYKCSVCGRLLVNITDGKNNVAKNYPYCHCGADMRGGEDDDNGID